jgi:hypothetical protein
MTKKRYNRKPVIIPGIETRNHVFVDFEWPFISSRDGAEYHVLMTPKGFTCECAGFTFHGKCRHINRVGELLTEENYTRYRA